MTQARTRLTPFAALLVLVLSLALASAACGGDGDTELTGTPPVLGVTVSVGGSPPPATTPAATPSSGTPAASGSTVIELVAQNRRFDKAELRVARGATVTVRVDNRDAGVNHGFVVHTVGSPNETLAASQTEVCTGPCRVEKTFQTPAEVSRRMFRCLIHTDMTGTFVIE